MKEKLKSAVYLLFVPLNTLLSLSVIFLVFAIKEGKTLDKVSTDLELINASQWFDNNIPDFGSYILYVTILLILMWLLYWSKKILPHFDMQQQNEITIEPMGSEMMIAYFGLFFFSLSVNSIFALTMIFILLFISMLVSNTYMYNPLLCFLRYKFYYITLSNRKKCILISKNKYAYNDKVIFNKLYKLNEYTYIE